MLLSELIDCAITETGQYILGDTNAEVLNCSNISIPRFWTITRKALYFYEKHKPVTKQLSIYAPQDFYEFGTGASPITPPKWISSVVPVGVTEGVLLTQVLFPQAATNEPRTFLWDYRSPRLYTTETGNMDITAHYPYTITETLNGSGSLIEVDIEEMTRSDTNFINLVTAHFLISLGRSRRSFVLQDLPIQFDAATLVEEGERMLEETKEALLATSRWWESLGV